MRRTQYRPLRILACLGTLALSLAAASTQAQVQAFTMESASGEKVVRLLVQAGTCPPVLVNGRPRASSPRAATADFPLAVCEIRLPASVHHATLEGHALPLAPALVRKIVVIGDTGCRLKASKKGGAWQACNDANAYPFARIAAAAARWKPDLVVHVGDYLYRESPCPDGMDACKGSPSGDTQAAWKADFFDPAAPLLAAAPWVMTRGNHETCERAGIGYRLLLDPAPLDAGTDCRDPAKLAAGDFSPTFAVPLGGGDQLIVFDSSRASLGALKPGDADYAPFVQVRDEIEALSRKTRRSFLVDHHPFLGYAAGKTATGTALYPGNQALISTFTAEGRALTPKGVQAVLSGHVHVFEGVSFSSGQPAQIVAGFSGTEEDTVPLPVTPPTDLQPAPGAVVAKLTSWVDGFGFLTMTRRGPGLWRIEVRNVEGAVINNCRLKGRDFSCAIAQPPTPPKS